MPYVHPKMFRKTEQPAKRVSDVPTPAENDQLFMERAKTRFSAIISKGVVTQTELNELKTRFGIVFRDMRPINRHGGEAMYRADAVASALANGDLIENRMFIPSLHGVG